jgi:hypothetical protein
MTQGSTNEVTRGRRLAVGVAAVTALASTQALGLFGGGSPSVFAPCPLPFVLIAFGPATPFGVPVIVATFVMLWCLPLFRGDGRVPTRTVILALLVGLSSAGWFASVAFQHLNVDGPLYAAIMLTASGVLAGATTFALRHARRQPGLRPSALAHACLFIWWVSYAYPWFGEVP